MRTSPLTEVWIEKSSHEDTFLKIFFHQALKQNIAKKKKKSGKEKQLRAVLLCFWHRETRWCARMVIKVASQGFNSVCLS